jgi:nucleolar protein 14
MPSQKRKAVSSANNPTEITTVKPKASNVVVKPGAAFGGLVQRKFAKQSSSLKKRDDMVKDYNNRHSANIIKIQKENNEINRSNSKMNKFLGKRDKKNIFDGNSDEEQEGQSGLILTHNGTAIDDLDRYDLQQSHRSEHSDVDEIDQEMLESLRFHNFDATEATALEGQEPKKKSRKEVYEEVIKKSKKAKAERQEFKEDYVESCRDLDSQVKDIKSIVTMTLKRDIKKVDGYNDDYMLLASRLSSERVVAPKVEKKLKTEENDLKNPIKKKKNVKDTWENGSSSDDGGLDAGVDGLKDGLSGKVRKFRDNEEVKNQKDVKKMEKTLGFLKDLGGGGSGGDGDGEEEELSELDLDSDEGEEESGSEDYVDYEGLDGEGEGDMDSEEGEGDMDSGEGEEEEE